MEKFNHKKNVYKNIATLIVACVALLMTLIFINPSEKSIIFVFIPIVLVWVMLFSVCRIYILLFVRHNAKLYTVLSFVAVSVVILLLLMSGIGQLKVVDIALVGLLACISAFYFYRSWA